MSGPFDSIRRVLRVGVWRRELDEELAFHFEQTVEELERTGMSRQAARDEARRRFGDEHRHRRDMEAIDRSAEMVRRWEGRWEVASDSVRHALRRMRRSPGFTAGVVLTFALGIGANATMFSILDRVLLSPPAHVADADRVHRLLLERTETHTGTRVPVEVVSYPDYAALSKTEALSGVAAVTSQIGLVRQPDGVRKYSTDLVTGSFFPVLGVRPHRGRFFTAEEDRIGGAPVAVISHGVWTQEFGADPGVLGKTLDFGNGAHTIVGVAPEGFTGMDLRPVDLWLPLHTTVGLTGNIGCIEPSPRHSCTWLRLVGRRAPGVEAAAVEAEATMRLLQERREDVQIGRLDPGTRVVAASLIAARGPLASDESKVATWLAAISLIVMLIACANVANLLLARAARQEREVGVRLALGSSSGRILGLALTESLLLALLGGVAAALLTRWGGVALRDVLLPGIVWEASGLELRVASVVLALALAAGVLSGIGPALQARSADVTRVLKSGGRGTSAGRDRARGTLTVVQAMLSVVLLVGAGLFVRSLHRVSSMDLGLDPDGVLSIHPAFEQDVPSERTSEIVRLAQERLRSLPGVEAVSSDVSVPFLGTSSTTVRPRGVDSVPELPTGQATLHRVGPDYFRVLRLSLRRGRGILPEDRSGSPPVAVVNETMARVFWPGQEALGKCLEFGYRNPKDPAQELDCVEVVGVVENARRSRLVEDETMQYYLPAAQSSNTSGTMLVRVRDDRPTAVETVRRELLRLDPALRYVEILPLRELVDAQARSWRLGATLFSLFGVLALVVAGVGLYSVLAFSVAQRTFELGVRAALGARPARLVALVMNRALALVGAGIALGLLTAWLVGPKLAPLLFETSPSDPLIYGAVAALLLGVAVAAACIPAWRATRVEPSVALRAD